MARILFSNFIREGLLPPKSVLVLNTGSLDTEEGKCDSADYLTIAEEGELW